MPNSVLPPHRPVRHRRALERAGWRTWLDYCENHVRRPDGELVAIEPRWTAEAERVEGERMFASATAPTIADAWAKLRITVAALEVTPHRS